MTPDPTTNPPPPLTPEVLVAGTQPRDMTATRRSCAASTHTHHDPVPDRMVTVVVVGDAARPFAAEPPRPTTATRPTIRVGWALVIAALAEIVVATAAIAAGAYWIGLAAVVFIGLAGLILCAAETVTSGGDSQ